MAGEEETQNAALEKHIALLEKLLATQQALNEAQLKQVQASMSVLNNATATESIQGRITDLTEKRAKIAAVAPTDEKDAARRKEELADLERQIQAQQRLSDAGKKHADVISNLRDKAAKHGAAINKMNQDAWNQGEKNLEQMSRQRAGQEKNKMGAEELGAAAKGAFQSAGGALQALGETPEMALGLFTGQIPGVKEFKTKLKKMFTDVDADFAGFRKSAGFSGEKVHDSMVYMLDPLYAERTAGLFKGLSAEAKPLSNIGLAAKDVAGSMKALTANAAFFRPNFVQANKASATFIGNLVAGLNKVGVPMETSAKNLNRFTKALKMTPKEAATSLKSLTSVADSLGLEFGKVAQNFDQVGGKLVQFGDNSVKVFAKLQAQAVGTGMAISELVEFAEGLDTFEGAADKAQGLNAVLGGTFVSVTDLVHADFDEKIELMQGAMADAGIEFDQADRRMQQVIASAAGLSVEEAAKMFGNKEAAEEMADAVDTSAMSQEDLKKRIEEGMSIAEVASKGMSSLAGGVDDFNKRVKKGATATANALSNEFGDMAKNTGNSEAAVLGLAGGLEILSRGSGAITSGLGGIGKAIAALGGGAVAKGAAALGTVTAAVAAGKNIAEGARKADDREQEAQTTSETPAETTSPKAGEGAPKQTKQPQTVKLDPSVVPTAATVPGAPGAPVPIPPRQQDTAAVSPAAKAQADQTETLKGLEKNLQGQSEMKAVANVILNLDGEKVAEVTTPFVLENINAAAQPA